MKLIKNKINTYIVTIRILRTRRIRNCPRIIVKMKWKMVNVDSDKDLTNPRYKKLK